MNSSFAVDQHGTSHISRRHHYDFSLERTRCSPASFHASSSSHHSQSSLDSKANDCDSKQSPNQGMANRSHPYTQFRTFQFGSCPQNFLRRRNLTNHQERVHLPPRYKCNFCHRLFQTQRLRLKHENGGRGFVGCGIRHKELNSNTNN